MQRRRFLASTALLGASAFAGCAQRDKSPPETPALTDGVVEVSFTTDPETVDVGREQPPQVTCDASADRVRVVGAAPSGNSCSSLYVERLSYADGELSMAVAGWESSQDCGDVLRVPTYEAVVELAGGLPERVRATEPATGESDTRTANTEC